MGKTFTEILSSWFEYFDKMKIDEKIEIAVYGRRDPLLFIQMCKEYINQGHFDFEFSNDYKYFKRINAN